MIIKKIAIGADHTGFEKKALIRVMLEKLGFEVKDFGTYSTESFDFPDAAHPVALAVESGEYFRGILLC
jgi:ribose 5-phosphate isomerase B